MGILRTTLVLGAIFVLLPSPPHMAKPGDMEVAGDPGTFGYVIAATDAFSDVKGFCMRKPAVCDAAGHMAIKIEAKAKYSAKLIYEWANDATAEPERKKKKPAAKDLDNIATGSVDILLPVPTSPNRES